MQTRLSLILLVIVLCDCDTKRPSLEDNELSRQVEKAYWLTVLGMKEVPVNITKPPVEKRSAPSYLMTIYSNTVSKLTNYTSYNLTNYDYDKASKSDTMVSVIAHHKTVQHTLRRMWFDVKNNNNDINYNESLISADLRLYRDNSLTLDSNRGLPFNITVYRYNKGDLRYINSQVVEADYDGWIVINITDCFQWWIDHPQENDGLRLMTIPIIKSRMVRHIQAEDIGISGFDNEPEKFAFVVGYYKSRSNIFDTFRYKRSALSQLNARERQVIEHRKSICQLQGMYVNFKEIGYWEWIIAPDGVEAQDCIGRCEYPFGSKINVMEHGLLKALTELHKLSCLVKAKCKPIKYSSGSTIYWSDRDKITYKTIQQLSATACGCR